jgi:hypothetical protein
MNKRQWITVALALINLILIGLFPPFDYVSPARNNVPTFDGFHWYASATATLRMNANFLQLEVFVILMNAAIAWLLLREPAASAKPKKLDWQKLVMIGVALNLLLVMLFPPMENYYAVTRAALASFDGFYFIFGEHGARTIVTQLLYLEVVFVLANGAILWMLFRKTGDMTDPERARLMKQLQQAGTRK